MELHLTNFLQFFFIILISKFTPIFNQFHFFPCLMAILFCATKKWKNWNVTQLKIETELKWSKIWKKKKVFVFVISFGEYFFNRWTILKLFFVSKAFLLSMQMTHNNTWQSNFKDSPSILMVLIYKTFKYIDHTNNVLWWSCVDATKTVEFFGFTVIFHAHCHPYMRCCRRHRSYFPIFFIVRMGIETTNVFEFCLFVLFW